MEPSIDLTSKKEYTYINLGYYNPFRYRGYYYDVETSLYYLQSRYYNPNVGRFINGDEALFLAFCGKMFHNLLCYCENNPINQKDLEGYISTNVVGAAIGAIIGAVDGSFLGKWLADQLGITGYWARTSFIATVASLAGAAAATIGYYWSVYC